MATGSAVSLSKRVGVGSCMGVIRGMVKRDGAEKDVGFESHHATTIGGHKTVG
jgi:hypothetical protein